MDTKKTYTQPCTNILMVKLPPMLLGGSVGDADMGSNPTLPGIAARHSEDLWDDEGDND